MAKSKGKKAAKSNGDDGAGEPAFLYEMSYVLHAPLTCADDGLDGETVQIVDHGDGPFVADARPTLEAMFESIAPVFEALAAIGVPARAEPLPMRSAYLGAEEIDGELRWRFHVECLVRAYLLVAKSDTKRVQTVGADGQSIGRMPMPKARLAKAFHGAIESWCGDLLPGFTLASREIELLAVQGGVV